MSITGTFEIVDRSKTKAPSCHKQLTMWVKDQHEIQFAIDQLDRHNAPWLLKKSLGRVAVFVPGEKDADPSA